MCSATMSGPPNSIGLYWTDEELIMSLARMNNGPPYPDNVVDGVNPYDYKPSNLPVDFWFFIRSDLKKDSEHGSWRANGEPSEIFSNSSITGLRTTLEFYEGRTPHAQRTNWVMQEYSITQKELCSNKNLKGFNLLCRVFLTGETIENKNMQNKMDIAESAGGSYLHPKPSVGPVTGNSLGLDVSQARSKAENTGPLVISDEHQHRDNQVENLAETDYIAQGDYLELDDLLTPGSRSFSSDDSSCVTVSSDEFFDSLALLKDLEYEINKGKEGIRANFKYNVASAKPDEVVFQPVASGSRVGSSNERQFPNEAVEKRARDKRVAENALEAQNVQNGNRSSSKSSSEDAEASASHPKLVSEGKKKRSGRKLKRLNKKYLCFMPF